MRSAPERLDVLLGPESEHPAALVWRGYISHALLFYRQNNLAGEEGLLDMGRKLRLGPGGAPPGKHPRESALSRQLVLRGLTKHERYWGSLRLSEESLADFERAADQPSPCAWAHLFSGMVHEMHRRYTRAIRSFDRAIALEPRWSWPYVLRGICRWYQADFRGSVAEFARASKLDPKSELPLLFMARAKADLRDRSLVKDLDKALKLAPESGFALSWRGRAMFVLKKTPKALSDLERSIPPLPDYDRGYSWLGVSYAELGQWKKALPLLERARALNPYYPTTLYPLARSHMEMGNWKEAADALKAAADIDRSGVWIEHRISMSHPNPAALRSLRELDRYITKFPKAAWAWAWRGQTDLLLQNYQRALSDLDAALTLAPADPWARVWRGETLRRLGDWPTALEEFDRALKKSPDLSWAHAGRGLCLLKLGDARAALKSLERSLKLQGHCAPALAWRGQALFALGRFRDAAESFEAALELHPQDHWLDAWLWKAKARLGDWSGARQALSRQLGNGASGSDEAWAVKGWLEGRLGQKNDAARSLSRALALNPRNSVALLVRQVGARRVDGGAVETLQGLGDPGSFFAMDNLLRRCSRSAKRALANGDFAKALSVLERETRGRRDIQTFLIRGWLKLRTGDAAGAIEEASRALDETLDPGCAPALWLREQARRA
jgi:tetratricopeptide (TPR) repeat protein